MRNFFSEATVGYTVALNTYKADKKRTIDKLDCLVRKIQTEQLPVSSEKRFHVLFFDEEMEDTIPSPEFGRC